MRSIRKAKARRRRIFHALVQSCLHRDEDGRQVERHRLDPVEVLDRGHMIIEGPPRSGKLMVSECRRCGALVTTAWRIGVGYTQNKTEIKRRELEAVA